jgi:hypothetical protein
VTRAWLLAAALSLTAAAPAAAAPQTVEIGDFSAPVGITSPPHDLHLFVVEQAGTIRVVGGGTFLDIRSLVTAGGEMGLLSMAFAPDYDTSGHFYVFYTSTAGGHHRVNIVRYTRSASDPLRADPASAKPILGVRHDSPEHNGGQLQFGPDGMLWAGIGDNQISPNAQDVTDNPFGKILRLDPATGKAAAGNPHGRVWAYGLRNPWRFSFDRGTGDLIIGDVGESAWEEINWGRAPERARNVNFGWPNNEGVGTFGENPVIAHDHTVSAAIIGGYVVRDPGLPTLNGRYLYGDLGDPHLRSAKARTGADDQPIGLEIPLLTSFGEDACGHIFATSLRGPVYRIQDGAVSGCSLEADTIAPHLTVRLRGLGDAARKRRVLVRVRCSEDCRLRIGGVSRALQLAGEQQTTMKVRLRGARLSRLRERLARGAVARVRVRIRAVDPVGNSRTVRRAGRVTG